MHSIEYLINLPALEHIINRSPLVVAPNTPVVDAIALMSQVLGSICELEVLVETPLSKQPSQEIKSCVLVVESERLLGILTERDVVKITADCRNLSALKINEVMTQQVVSLKRSQDTNALTALSLLRQHRIRHLPIVDDEDKLLGVITYNSIRSCLQPTNLLKIRSCSEVMTTETIQALANASVLSVAQLMIENRVSCVVIVEYGANKNSSLQPPCYPLGIITERDIVQFQVMELDLARIDAKVVMSTPLFCLHPEDSLWTAHQQMQQRRIRRLVVAGSGGELVGIVTQSSLLQALDPIEMSDLVIALKQHLQEQTRELKQVNQHLQQEIKKRQQTEEALRQSHRELEKRVEERTAELAQANKLSLEQAALLDVATNAIFVRGLDSTILYWNKGAERLYGWQKEEIIGKSANEILYSEYHQLEEALQNLLQNNSWRGELNLTAKDRKNIIVDSQWTLARSESGQPKFILTVDTDITEKKQLEAQCLRTQRLESLGTLASGIAHDFNNILTPILASAQLLRIKFPNADEQTQMLIKVMQDTSKRGADLVKQILSFARGAEGKRTVLQIQHLLSEVVKIARSTFPKSIEIHTNIVTTGLRCVCADATQLHQLLMNLCVNARDAMPQGGILTIGIENRYIDAAYAQMNLSAKIGEYVVITIADTGTGIPPEIQEIIFDPFFTTKEPGLGTGLGLSTVLGIIKNHDGFIEVYSEIGKGTCFKVYFPATSMPEIPSIENTEIHKGNGELILVVDDDSAVLQITQASLENYNYSTLIASDGVEAIARFAKNRKSVVLVLIDIMMPTMDGLTAIPTLKKLNPNVKIIATSGLSANQLLSPTMNSFIDAFLAKPYSMKELLTVINTVLTA